MAVDPARITRTDGKKLKDFSEGDIVEVMVVVMVLMVMVVVLMVMMIVVFVGWCDGVMGADDGVAIYTSPLSRSCVSIYAKPASCSLISLFLPRAFTVSVALLPRAFTVMARVSDGLSRSRHQR